MIAWLKKLIRMSNNYESDLHKLEKKIDLGVEEIRKRTSVDFDIRQNGICTIITIGRYHNRDYVECYDVDVDAFATILDMVRSMKKYGTVRYVDCSPAFRGAIKHEIS